MLKSNKTGALDIWWGQDFGGEGATRFNLAAAGGGGGGGEREESSSAGPFAVHYASDLSALPLNFTLDDFAAQFKKAFPESDVTVLFLANLIYIFRRHLVDFSSQSRFFFDGGGSDSGRAVKKAASRRIHKIF